MKLRLIEIGRDGTPARCPGYTPPAARDAMEGMAAFYEDAGFVPPWVGYLADRDGDLVGTCAFLGAPRDGVVEMDGQVFAGHDKRGVASEMFRQLLRLAQAADTGLTVHARSPAAEGPGARILTRLGFTHVGADDGQWLWALRLAEMPVTAK